MYYLFRDDLLIQIGHSPEHIVSEVNKALAGFRTYGGLNFLDEETHLTARYGTLRTNLVVKWDKEEDKALFEKVVGVNY